MFKMTGQAGIVGGGTKLAGVSRRSTITREGPRRLLRGHACDRTLSCGRLPPDLDRRACRTIAKSLGEMAKHVPRS
jgi:hypothetical protein